MEAFQIIRIKFFKWNTQYSSYSSLEILVVLAILLRKKKQYLKESMNQNGIKLIVVFLLLIAVLALINNRQYFESFSDNSKSTSKIGKEVQLEKLKFLLKNIRRHCGNYPTSNEGFLAMKNSNEFYKVKCKDLPPNLWSEIIGQEFNQIGWTYISDGKSFVLTSPTGSKIESDNNSLNEYR